MRVAQWIAPAVGLGLSIVAVACGGKTPEAAPPSGPPPLPQVVDAGTAAGASRRATRCNRARWARRSRPAPPPKRQG